MTRDGSEPKLSGVSITFSDMSFVEDNSLGNVLRYARMMHGDLAVSGLHKDSYDPLSLGSGQAPLPPAPHLPWRNQQTYNSRLGKIEF